MSRLVSVLMAAYNCDRFVEKAVYSILNQTYFDLELVIIDDCSSDRTFSILESIVDSRIRLYRNEVNIGYLRTFNKLIGFAEGELITFQDADDYSSKERLSLLVHAFDNDPQLGMCGSNFVRVDERGKEFEVSKLPRSYGSIQKYLKSHDDVCFCGSSVMVRKEVITKIGGYRVFFDGCTAEDFDWLRRISEKFKSVNIEESLYYYRFCANTLSRRVNVDIKKRHIAEIVRFLSVQRQEDGVDSLTSGDLGPLNRFMDQLAIPYDNDKSLLDRRVAIEYAINGDSLKSLKHAFLAIGKGLLKFNNYVSLFYSLIVILFPNYFLLKIKSVLGLKHVSSRL